MRACCAALLALLLAACDPGGGEFTPEDAGTSGPGGVTYEDIGTVCTYDPESSQNPSNSCAKAGMTCVIATRDGYFRNYGHFTYEAVPLFTRFRADGKDEGICTLVSGPGMPLPACPTGTAIVKLSSGHHICMRPCTTSAECGRDGFVCDYRFMDGNTYNPNTGQVAPLAVRLCVPACQTDLPFCMRTFFDTQGYFYVYEGDLYGWRQCNTISGLCEELAFKGSGYVGNQCVSSADCGENLLCMGAWLYGAPEDHGFCTRYCNPDPNVQPPDNGCQLGYGCEYMMEVGFCFPDCSDMSCGGANQVCAYANEDAAGILPGQEWRGPHCIQCELSSLTCGD